MKKLLSILVGMFLGIVAASATTVKITAHASPTTGGIVTLKNREGQTASGSKDVALESNSTDGIFGLGAKKATITLSQKANPGYMFTHWSLNADGSTEDNTNHSFSVEKSRTEQSVNLTYYAIFKEIISPMSKEITLIKYDNKVTAAKISVSVRNSGSLDISSDAGISVTTNGENGEYELVVSADANAVEIGKSYNISLETNIDNAKKITYTVHIVGPPTIILAGANGGTYVAYQTNMGKKYEVTTSSVSVEISESNGYFFSLIPTPATDHKFERWEIKDEQGNVKYKYNDEKIVIDGNEYICAKLDGSDLKNGTRVTPKFVPKDYAMFVIKNENPYKPYSDLDEILRVAQDPSSASSVVVVHESGIISTVGKELRDNKYHFEIPNGVTLLIPGEATYDYQTGDLGTKDIVSSSTSKQFRYLTMPQSTEFDVHGNLCVYSQLSMAVNGTPTSYGQLIMNSDCKISMHLGSVLHVLGYITSEYETSNIIALSGAKVYEAFQFSDWRGGNALTSFISPSTVNKVFPIQQYYVQNIEPELQLFEGATEYVCTCAATSEQLGGLIPAMQTPMTILLISEDNNNGNDEDDNGLFCLNTNTSLRKWYDKERDKQMYVLSGDPSEQSGSCKMRITNMGLVFPIPLLGEQALESKNYILPITSNIELKLENIYCTIPYAVSFLAGSVVEIDNKSVVEFKTSGSPVVLYDREQNWGYFGASNVKLAPIKYTPSNSQYLLYNNKQITNSNAIYIKDASNRLYKRQIEAIDVLTINNAAVDIENEVVLEDAKFIVNGTIKLTAGGLYTTKDGGRGLSTNATDYGANITSDGGGVVEFTSIGGQTQTYQIEQSGSGTDTKASPISIPITNARLRNADGSWSAGENAADELSGATDKSYIYYTDAGAWLRPTDAITQINPPTLNITLPDQTAQGEIQVKLRGVFDVKDFGVDISNELFILDKEHMSVNTERKELIIPVSYKARNIHGSDEATLTITVEGEEKSFTQHLTVTENYKPDFTVETPIEFSAVVDEEPSITLVFRPASRNVTTLYSGNPKWTYELLGDGASQFKFAFGAGENVLSGNELTFVPTSGGNKSATLRLIATYTDAQNHPEQHIVEIPLIGTAHLKPNTLAFNVDKFPSPIYDYTPAFILFKEGSRNNDMDLSFTISGDPVIALEGDGKTTPYTIKPIVGSDGGTAHITVSQPASEQVEGLEGDRVLRYSFSIIYQAVLNPLPLCVNEKYIYKAHSYSSKHVSYNAEDKAILFESTPYEPSEWVVRFDGVADEISFTPTGAGLWYVEESSTSDPDSWSPKVNWSILTSTQTISLQPTTRFVRFKYSAGASGKLRDVCISDLQVKVSDKDLYMPIYKDQSTTTKVIKLTYVSNTPLTLESSNSAIISTNYTTLPATNDGYGEMEITVTSAAKDEDQYYLYVKADDEVKATVAIQTGFIPQGLPYKMAQDPSYRYYFNKKASINVDWDKNNKRMLFLPAVEGNTTRFVEFYFEGSPSIVSFETGIDVVSRDWVIQESSDGQTWNDVIIADREIFPDGRGLKQQLRYQSRYIRIRYIGGYSNEFTVSNLIIEGYPSVIVEPEDLAFTDEKRELQLKVTTINLQNIKVVLDNTTDFKFRHEKGSGSEEYQLTANDYPSALGKNKVGDIFFNVNWIGTDVVNDGMITIINMLDQSVLAKVKLIGADNYILYENADGIGINTGIPNDYTYDGKQYAGYNYHPVSLKRAFSEDGTAALFDYLFVYGPTTTSDGTNNITLPTNTPEPKGSNAVTPIYVYKRDVDAYGVFDRYRFVKMVANANAPSKDVIEDVTSMDDFGANYIDIQDSLRVYMTGFCPFATTGHSKVDEGVWFFRGEAGEKVDVYLEDCHIFSRNKTEGGHPFIGRIHEKNPTFSEGYARGSGGVLVFECTTLSDNDFASAKPLEVTIHTVGDNLLRSNYGCFYQFLGRDPFQISAPIHIHMHSVKHVMGSKTTLTFDDKWPIALNAKRGIVDSKRTNGFLSLQKQKNTNNAPSIDLGNPHTVVNFKGGRIELQNAQIVSPNYKTTLAISYRAGEMGGDNVGLRLAYGIGTDSVGGTVNFYDGTTTVIPMEVEEEYQKYYLMDAVIDEEGDTAKDANGEVLRTNITSCLRCPKNTYVYGGSQCWMRSCQHVTSKGGAPKDGPAGSFLGRYVYTIGIDDVINAEGLVTTLQFPDNIKDLAKYYSDKTSYKKYGLESVSPDKNGKLYFWIPEGYGGVTAEQDRLMTTWKACMTEIAAGYGTIKGAVGGPTPVELNEEVKYLLYCKIDQNINNVITQKDPNDETSYTYKAPVKVPGSNEYMEIPPISVGNELQNQILSDTSYIVTDKVYYIANATADVWQTFSAPFDVAKIWVVETYSETELDKMAKKIAQENKNSDKPLNPRAQVLLEQARHNADFAAFFGVAMAIGTTEPLESIFTDFINWGKIQDAMDIDRYGNPRTPLYTAGTDYKLRNKYELIPYYYKEDGTANWDEAHFYLNHNKENWDMTIAEDSLRTKWEMLTQADIDDGILLHQGQTYSMLFPYCTGCGISLDTREYWDYWSGKFLIFESVGAPQTIKGRDYLDESKKENVFTSIPDLNNVVVTGNSTFALMETTEPAIYIYSNGAGVLNGEAFYPNMEPDEDDELTLPVSTPTKIWPTTAFLYGNLQNRKELPIRSIGRAGNINYGNGNQNGTSGGGHMPTVGGGNDMFITAIEGGINIAVAEPQMVKVMSSTGAVLFAGYITTATDVQLPTHGIYIVSGENEVQKILH